MTDFRVSHPWITFQLDLRRFTAELWMLLGEAQSKCEHIAGVPLPPAVAQRLHTVYLAKGVQATTAIEGNTLNEDEVHRRIEGNLALSPSREYLGVEVDNVTRALNRIASRCLDAHMPRLAVEEVLEYNREILTGLPVDAAVVAGRLRTFSVTVGSRFRGAPYEQCRDLLGRTCDWLGGPELAALEHYGPVASALVRAVLAHLYLAWIHPFGDGNGRTARLIEFRILVSAGVPLPAAHLLSNFYNETRSEYYRQLQQASDNGGNVVPFLEYAIRGFVDALREQLIVVRNTQWGIAWNNYINDQFPDLDSATEVRRRHLALDISGTEQPLRISELANLNARTAKAYKTTRTLERDVRHLESLELVRRDSAGRISANRELILAFLPTRRERA
jgi:Fic family protein